MPLKGGKWVALDEEGQFLYQGSGGGMSASWVLPRGFHRGEGPLDLG